MVLGVRPGAPPAASPSAARREERHAPPNRRRLRRARDLPRLEPRRGPGRLVPPPPTRPARRPTARPPPPRRTRRWCSRYYDEAYNARNTAVIDELLADDFVRHNVAVPQQNQAPNNADDVARVESWLAAFSDLQITIEELFATDDTVVSFVVWRGTQDGPLPQWDAPGDGAADGAGIARRLARGVRRAGRELDRAGQPDHAAPAGDHHRDEELPTAGTPTVATPAP